MQRRILTDRKTRWSRLLVVPAIASLLAATAPAYAAVERCISEGESGGAQVVPGTGGGQRTRAIARQQARNTWDDHIWVGKPGMICPRGATECDQAWQKAETKTTGWNVGTELNVGNATNPWKKWWNPLATFVGRYGQTKEVSESFTWTVHFKAGDTAEPVLIVRRRWVQGDWEGGWVRTNRGCRGGKIYTWDGNRRFGSWTTNRYVNEYASYKVNGRVL
jgi:hypothetical protein